MADKEGHRLGGADPKPQPKHGQQHDGDQAHASGKKLYVDEGELNQALVHLKNAIDTLNDAYASSQYLDSALKPGNEYQSAGFTSIANKIGKRKRAEILEDQKTLQAMYDNLKATVDNHRETEQANAESLRRTQP